MGDWGVAVFADDVAADVRADWRELMLDQVDPAEATDRLAERYQSSDDEVVFWIALAAAQMETGRLLDHVRDKAVALIDAGDDLDLWREQGLERQRQRVLDRFRVKLLGPQRPPARLRRPVRHAVLFEIGDAILVCGGDRGPGMLAVVVDQSEEGDPKKIGPVIEPLAWDGGALPTADEMAALPPFTVEVGAGTPWHARKPLLVMLATSDKAEAFGPEFGGVVAKGVQRPVPLPFGQGMVEHPFGLGLAEPNAPTINWRTSWPSLAQTVRRGGLVGIARKQFESGAAQKELTRRAPRHGRTQALGESRLLRQELERAPPGRGRYCPRHRRHDRLARRRDRADLRGCSGVILGLRRGCHGDRTAGRRACRRRALAPRRDRRGSSAAR